MRKIKKYFAWGGYILGLAIAVVTFIGVATNAQQSNADKFALQVTPSPLVITVKPGVPKDVQLNVENLGKNTENLRIDLRKFSVDKKNGDIKLEDDEPADVPNWVTFSKPTFTVESKKTATQNIHIALPSDSGFSYSFTFVISRASGDSKEVPGGASIHGSVAIFALINVDRPGAVRQFEVSNFAPTSPIFEYLPADFNITFQNIGNTIIRPAGNVFIQRGSDDAKALATLSVNNSQGYLLPGNPRIFKTSWKEGFPVFKTTTDSAGKQKSDLAWDWSKLADFRFGQYTAKMIAIYNDGQRDVPVMRETTFWVIPWRAILVLIAIIAIVLLLLRRVIHKRTHHAVKKALADKDKK
jgi:hypothetical protein